MDKLVYLAVDGKTVAKLVVDKTTSLKSLLDSGNRFLQSQGIAPGNFSVILKLSDKEEIPSWVLSNVQYSEISPYNQIVDQKSFLIYTKVLTGVKDLDFKVLMELDDKDLLNFCVVNKYAANELCKDDLFWKKRFIKRFGEDALEYNTTMSWKNYYLQAITDIEQVRNGMIKQIKLDLTGGREDLGLQPYTDKEIDDFILEKSEDIDDAAFAMYDIFRDSDELEDLRTAELDWYREFLDDYLGEYVNP